MQYIALFIAHGFCDFVLRSDWSPEDKQEKTKYSSLKYALVHWPVALVALLPWGLHPALRLSGLVALGHLAVHYVQRLSVHVMAPLAAFLISQSLSMIGVAVMVANNPLMPDPHVAAFASQILPLVSTSRLFITERSLLIIMAYLYVGFGGALVVRMLLNQLLPRAQQKDRVRQGRAGKVIGILERLLILTFVLIQAYSAVAFVLTAKSLARYERITKEQDFAEYYLVGTLASTFLAVGGGLLLSQYLAALLL